MRNPGGKHAFSLLSNLKDTIATLSIILWPIESKLYEQIVGIPMGTNYAPLVADLFCHERDVFVSFCL